MMTKEVHEALADLREEGYAIAIIYPRSMGKADARTLENMMVQHGLEVLEKIGKGYVKTPEQVMQ